MWLVGDDYAQRHRTDAIYITIDFAFVDNTRMILVFSPFYLYHCVLYPYFLILWTHVSVCLCISCFWWKGKVCFWIGHGQTLVAVFWSLFFFFFTSNSPSWRCESEGDECLLLSPICYMGLLVLDLYYISAGQFSLWLLFLRPLYLKLKSGVSVGLISRITNVFL